MWVFIEMKGQSSTIDDELCVEVSDNRFNGYQEGESAVQDVYSVSVSSLWLDNMTIRSMTCCYLGDKLFTVASNGLISGMDLVMHTLGHFKVASLIFRSNHLKTNSCLEALLLELEIIKSPFIENHHLQ